jgi:hypothetical protein
MDNTPANVVIEAKDYRFLQKCKRDYGVIEELDPEEKDLFLKVIEEYSLNRDSILESEQNELFNIVRDNRMKYLRHRRDKVSNSTVLPELFTMILAIIGSYIKQVENPFDEDEPAKVVQTSLDGEFLIEEDDDEPVKEASETLTYGYSEASPKVHYYKYWLVPSSGEVGPVMITTRDSFNDRVQHIVLDKGLNYTIVDKFNRAHTPTVSVMLFEDVGMKIGPPIGRFSMNKEKIELTRIKATYDKAVIKDKKIINSVFSSIPFTHEETKTLGISISSILFVYDEEGTYYGEWIFNSHQSILGVMYTVFKPSTRTITLFGNRFPFMKANSAKITNPVESQNKLIEEEDKLSNNSKLSLLTFVYENDGKTIRTTGQLCYKLEKSDIGHFLSFMKDDLKFSPNFPKGSNLLVEIICDGIAFGSYAMNEYSGCYAFEPINKDKKRKKDKGKGGKDKKYVGAWSEQDTEDMDEWARDYKEDYKDKAKEITIKKELPREEIEEFDI